MILNLNDILTKAKQQSLSFTSYKIQEAVSSPIVSKHHNNSGKTIKVNLAAIAIEMILKKEISVLLSSSGAIYFEIISLGAKVFVDSDFALIAEYDDTSFGTKENNHCICVVASLLKAMFSNLDTYDELRNYVEKIYSSFNSNKVVDRIDLLIFCDSYNYTVASSESFTFETSSLVSYTNQMKFEYTKGEADVPVFAKKIGLNKPAITSGLIKNVQSEKKQEETLESIFNKAKNGDYILSYSWTVEEKKHIPDLSYLDEFVPNDLFAKLIRKITFRFKKVDERLSNGTDLISAIGNDYINSIINGRPSSGKTKTIYAVGAALGLPVYTVSQSKRTEEDEYQGKNKVIHGVIEFKETNFLKGYCGGGIIALEEFNLTDPAVTMGSLGQAIEFPFVLEKDGYDEVRRNPHCVIFSTMNVGVYGTKPTSQALSSRHRQDYIQDDPSTEDFIKILMMTYNDKRCCQRVYRVYKNVLSWLLSHEINREDIALSITLRSCQGALQNIEEGSSMEVALKDTIIGKISEFDLELAQIAYTNIVSILPQA